MWRFLIPALALALSASPSQAQEPRAQRGFTFVQTHCAMCHSIGRFGESPLSEAPPFRTLSQIYPIENLAESLAEGIITGHPSMPEFQLDPGQVNDVIAYLELIQQK
ncbi:c-type cytochrome [Microvirga roseola]|uniref:c-type cytochrome n=1 Tax=Microvirga roseola TaxID=2883126 RepID=UPI001E418108|nr:cytochrome c [Microvirga roseola]